nr:MAG TPA: hypothetical protein [Caudoviricetes sp.]
MKNIYTSYMPYIPDTPAVGVSGCYDVYTFVLV